MSVRYFEIHFFGQNINPCEVESISKKKSICICIYSCVSPFYYLFRSGLHFTQVLFHKEKNGSFNMY